MNINSTSFDDFQSKKWGFHKINEILHGRIAMLALIVIIIIESFTKKNLINLIQVIIFSI
ncbi:unnamed protein product [Discosporangium mesarthrocarpum]